MPDAFREIVRLQNATNAAILYDDSFGEMLIEMYHIYTKIKLYLHSCSILFLNLRHFIFQFSIRSLVLCYKISRFATFFTEFIQNKMISQISS